MALHWHCDLCGWNGNWLAGWPVCLTQDTSSSGLTYQSWPWPCMLNLFSKSILCLNEEKKERRHMKREKRKRTEEKIRLEWEWNYEFKKGKGQIEKTKKEEILPFPTPAMWAGKDRASDLGLLLCSSTNIKKNDNYLFVIMSLQKSLRYLWMPFGAHILRLKCNDLIFYF